MQVIESAKAQFTGAIFAPTDPGAANWVTIVNNIINVVLIIASALAVIYLIYSGILYITAAGNPDAAKKGQQGVINGVIGIVIIVAVYTIIRVAMNLATTQLT